MKNILLLICLFSFSHVIGQGDISIKTSPTIENMMTQFTSKHKSEKSIKGWRIQIITTDNRRKMESARGKFSALYPDIDVKWNHVAPYYRVRVGAYENKMQLMGFLLELKNEFPGVIPVMADINKSELVIN